MWKIANATNCRHTNCYPHVFFFSELLVSPEFGNLEMLRHYQIWISSHLFHPFPTCRCDADVLLGLPHFAMLECQKREAESRNFNRPEIGAALCYISCSQRIISLHILRIRCTNRLVCQRWFWLTCGWNFSWNLKSVLGMSSFPSMANCGYLYFDLLWSLT